MSTEREGSKSQGESHAEAGLELLLVRGGSTWAGVGGDTEQHRVRREGGGGVGRMCRGLKEKRLEVPPQLVMMLSCTPK